MVAVSYAANRFAIGAARNVALGTGAGETAKYSAKKSYAT
jgi:hypothetical protein